MVFIFFYQLVFSFHCVTSFIQSSSIPQVIASMSNWGNDAGIVPSASLLYGNEQTALKEASICSVCVWRNSVKLLLEVYKGSPGGEGGSLCDVVESCVTGHTEMMIRWEVVYHFITLSAPLLLTLSHFALCFYRPVFLRRRSVSSILLKQILSGLFFSPLEILCCPLRIRPFMPTAWNSLHFCPVLSSFLSFTWRLLLLLLL